ncbi:trehalose-phosphatase [Rhizosaccharibacter radicis]|uniref:Trehalose 6-phosphate phosphatase n=1 Tax=Rhizosaccharibacter radicis TaxID=2782605 RepID=A0ABT1W258_9PROT|nr:trehalose-phosphatase [Acetobacteraceae bacterium KSS12]
MSSSVLPARLALPEPSRAAFLLDFDGTLVDIAPTPEGVVVPPGLAEALIRLRERCGDALAIVSGRPIAQIDGFLPGVPFAVAGEHGLAIRHEPDGEIERATLPPLPQGWLDRADALIAAHPGARVERKHSGFVLHYRACPEAGGALEAALRPLVDEAGGAFHLQAAKMAWEVRVSGIDKGSAVRALMARAPFTGRLPVFVGDDITDEDGIKEARATGGIGLRIPDDIPDPEVLRRWLHALAEGSGWAG